MKINPEHMSYWDRIGIEKNLNVSHFFTCPQSKVERRFERGEVIKYKGNEGLVYDLCYRLNAARVENRFVFYVHWYKGDLSLLKRGKAKYCLLEFFELVGIEAELEEN